MLGDDKASASFNKFARSVESANRSVDRHNAALSAQGKAATAAQGGILSLAGTVTGFGAAQDVASRKTSMFAKVLAGINLATGVLEPAMAGLIVTTGALAAAGTAAAAGMGAYGLALKPVMTQVSDLMKLQEQAAKGSKASQEQLQKALKTTPPVVVAFAASVTRAKTAYTSWGDSLARPVLAPLTLGLRFVKPVLAAISPLVRAAAGAVRVLVGELGGMVLSPSFERGVQTLLPHVQPVILNLAHAFGNVASGIWGIVKAFLPMSDTITGGVEKLTAKFKQWGQSLPSHSGFKALMTMFRQQTPLAVGVLKNLAVIIGNVARATVGLASPANSKALLQILTPLTQIMARLTANQGLVRAVLYFLLLRKTLMSLSPAFLVVRGGFGFLANLPKMLAIAQLVVLKGVVLAIAAATKIWTAAQWLLNVAMNANPVGLIITGIAALIAVFVLLWKKCAWFRDFWRAAWGVIKGAAVAVWDWIKGHWPLLLSILTGPIGAAVIWIVRHWGMVTAAFRAAIQVLRNAFAAFVNFVLGIFGTILHGAARAFGWIPGIGGKLRGASAAFDRFRRDVNNSIRGINGRTVTVGVNLSTQKRWTGMGAASGGHVQGLIRGQGGPTADRAGLFALSDREYVIRAASVSKYGTRFLDAVNAGRLAGGGLAGGGQVTVTPRTPPESTIRSNILAGLTAAIDSIAKRLIEALTGGSGSKLVNYARQFVGRVPYVWGGSTPAGWDCSGFTSWVYHHFGYPAPRTSQQQQLWAKPSGDKAGALVFFYGRNGAASHVGLSMGNGKMINAYGTGYGTIISPSRMAGFSGFGVPPRGFARGGVITEPITGVGLRSGRRYMFGERGPETVTPGRGGTQITIGPVYVSEAADVDLLARRLAFGLGI